MKRTLSVLALLGAMFLAPQVLSDASASSVGSATTCDSSCDPGSCPIPCSGSCDSGCPFADAGTQR